MLLHLVAAQLRVKAFDTTEKIKRNKNYTINKLNKEAGRKVLEQVVRNSC